MLLYVIGFTLALGLIGIGSYMGSSSMRLLRDWILGPPTQPSQSQTSRKPKSKGKKKPPLHQSSKVVAKSAAPEPVGC